MREFKELDHLARCELRSDLVAVRRLDGLLDREEPQLGTNPLAWDSDGDGVNDAGELAAGSDPVDRLSYS